MLSTTSAARRLVRTALVLGATALAACEDWPDGCCGTYTPCTTGFYCDSRLADVRDKAADVGSYVAVQRADESALGNPVSGTAAALGGAGRVAFDVRAARLRRQMPAVSSVAPSFGGSTPTTFAENGSNATSITSTVAIGVLGGIGSSDIRIGAVDLLGGVTWYQNPNVDALHLESSSSMGAQIGVRVGIAQESKILPSISYTYMRRHLPQLSFAATLAANADGTSGTIGGTDIELSSTGWRVVASKALGNVELSAGMGTDHYQASGTYTGTITQGTAVLDGGSSSWAQYVDRNHLFAGVAYRAGAVTITGELGRMWTSASQPALSTNTFAGGAIDRSRTYLDIGFRLPVSQ